MLHSLEPLYERIGGAETLRKLVEAFYSRVAKDPDLSPIFPDDFTEIKEKQYRFLTQYLGGPTLYSDVYGHPMMRARHMPFPITPKRRDAWLKCMAEAMEEVGIRGAEREEMFARLTLTAHHMVNTPDEAESSD
ncbi:hypothetical protein BSNK01_31580 [Bacillaceae bacterium]